MYIVCTKAWKRVLGLMESILNILIVLLDWNRDACWILLFPIFVNELAKLIENSDVHGIQLFPDITELILLLFADDIVLISDTIKGLQRQLKILENFCEIYKLIVNVIKTKVMVFRLSGRLRTCEKNIL